MLAHKIPGQLFTKSCDILYEYVSSLKDGAEILECGSLFGKSTVSILEGCENKHLDVVDIWSDDFIEKVLQWDSISGDSEYIEETKQISQIDFHGAWLNNVKKHPNFNRIRNIWRKNSLQLEKVNYDLVLLDDNHTYTHLTKELQKFGHNKIVIVDDNQMESVYDAVEDFCELKGRNFYCEGSFLVIK